MGSNLSDALGRRIFHFAALIILSVVIAACGGAGDAGLAVEETNSQEGIEETNSQEGIEETEADDAPAEGADSVALGKLLDPCALIPPAEVQAYLGDEAPITTDNRQSFWQPDDNTRTYYYCRFSNNYDRGVEISVEPYADASLAAAQMQNMLDYYNGSLEGEGLEPMAEVSGLGDAAYRYTIAPENYTIPDLYFLSGNYLITIYIARPGETPEANAAHFGLALEFAQNAVAQLPTDTSAILADQDLALDGPSEPAGKRLEPCALVTRDEAQTFISSPIVQEESSSVWDLGEYFTYQCSYRDDLFNGVDILVEEYVDLAFFYGLVEDQRNAGIEVVEVSGIGDAAFQGWNYSDISVVTGNYVINITTPAEFELDMELAELALSRMP